MSSKLVKMRGKGLTCDRYGAQFNVGPVLDVNVVSKVILRLTYDIGVLAEYSRLNIWLRSTLTGQALVVIK